MGGLLMDEQSLAISFNDSLTSDVSDCVGEFVEIGLDSIMDEGLLKEIPFISTAVSIYRIGKSIRERHHIKKLAAFLNEINHNIADDEKRQEYREKFLINDEFRNQELEYILILIERYIGIEKPQMLAKLYLAFLDGIIIWEEFLMYAEVVDRFLLLDRGALVTDSEKTIVHRNIGGESVLRLVALGLMTEVTNTSPFEEHGNGNLGMSLESINRVQTNNKTYQRTEFGEKLANILR